MSKAIIILADGFEEIEACSIIDILRRAGVDLTIAGMDKSLIKGAHQLAVQTDTTLDKVSDQLYDAIILPGGEPGTTNLQNNQLVADVVKAHVSAEKIIAAICAAPRILDSLGLIQGKRATSYPGAKPHMTSTSYTEDRVVVDGNLVTSRGPGTAMFFGYQLAEMLASKDTANKLREGMLAAQYMNA